MASESTTRVATPEEVDTTTLNAYSSKNTNTDKDYKDTEKSNTQKSVAGEAYTHSYLEVPDEEQAQKNREFFDRLPNGATKAFLDTYNKPDPRVAEEEAKKARSRARLANIAEATRLLIDMGSGAIGGNIYARDGVEPIVTKAKDEAKEAKDNYTKQLKDFNDNLLRARNADYKRKSDLEDAFLQSNKRYTKDDVRNTTTTRESDKTGHSTGTSSTKGNATKEVINPLLRESQSSGNGTISKTKDGNMLVSLPTNRYDKNGNKVGGTEWRQYELTKAQFNGAKGAIVTALLNDEKTIKQMSESRPGMSIDDVKKLLNGEDVNGVRDEFILAMLPMSQAAMQVVKNILNTSTRKEDVTKADQSGFEAGGNKTNEAGVKKTKIDY